MQSKLGIGDCWVLVIVGYSDGISASRKLFSNRVRPLLLNTDDLKWEQVASWGWKVPRRVC